MTIQDVYTKINGDYKDVLNRLRKPELIQKFAIKFLDDKSFENLVDALDEENYEDAFRAVHTLKGVCMNLGFAGMYVPANELTELLRARENGVDRQKAEEVFKELETQYNLVVDGINEIC